MMKLGFVMLVLTAACQGKGDDCQQFWDKTSPIISKLDGRAMPADAKDKYLKECRSGDTMKKDPVFKCVLDASGNDAVSACLSKAFGDYAKKSKSSEGKLQLNKLGKNLKTFHVVEGKFPEGKAALTPAEPCCKGEGGKCAVNDAQWTSNPTWEALEFMVAEPHSFQYSYESDGKTATATAVGDADCDGTTVTFKLEASAGADGAVTVKIIEPTTED
jgi:hypothetical protein